MFWLRVPKIWSSDMLTLSQRRSLGKHGQAKVEREQQAWRDSEKIAAEKARQDLIAAKKADRQAEQNRVKITRDELTGALMVRDQFGWHKVRKVNTKTVSVDSGYSWADLIPLDKVLDYRK